MKCQTIAAFERHLQNPQEAMGVYVILASDMLERQFLASLVIGALKTHHPQLQVVVLDLSKISVDALKDTLTTADLFAAQPLVHLKHLEESSKELLEALYALLSHREGKPPVLVEGEHIKNDPKLYDRLHQQLVMMDLTKEKPWDRKNRLIQWVRHFALQHKKSLQEGILDELYQKCHKDLSQMVQEVEKLICYTKDGSVITREHFKMLCKAEEEWNGWSLAEAIVWDDAKGIAVAAAHEIDVQQLHAMIGQLRYHYQMGIALKQLMVSDVDEHQLVSHFPTLPPKTLQKYVRKAAGLQIHRLERALHALFECEIKAKSQLLSAELLWVDLLAHLSQDG